MVEGLLSGYVLWFALKVCAPAPRGVYVCVFVSQVWAAVPSCRGRGRREGERGVGGSTENLVAGVRYLFHFNFPSLILPPLHPFSFHLYPELTPCFIFFSFSTFFHPLISHCYFSKGFIYYIFLLSLLFYFPVFFCSAVHFFFTLFHVSPYALLSPLLLFNFSSSYPFFLMTQVLFSCIYLLPS